MPVPILQTRQEPVKIQPLKLGSRNTKPVKTTIDRKESESDLEIASHLKFAPQGMMSRVSDAIKIYNAYVDPRKKD